MTRVNIDDVARQAGVSRTAVSFAFNYPERLSQATLDRVLEVAGHLGYSPHPTARALSLRRSRSIGILIPQSLSTVFANPFTSALIQSLGVACEANDLTLLLVPPLAGSLEGSIRQAAVDGFISLGLSPGDPALEALRRLGLPTVLIDAEGDGGQAVVNVDDRGGAEAAARHLVALSEPLVVTATPTPEAGARAFAGLPGGRERPTAVLAMSDMAAIGLMAAAREAGVRVPEDLSVVGFDDIPLAAWTNPALTTVRQPIADKGRLAASLLISLLEGEAVTSPPPLATSLIVRSSTTGPREVIGAEFESGRGRQVARGTAIA